ncbi:MAG: protein kinase [Elusimicrobiota bacterium]
MPSLSLFNRLSIALAAVCLLTSAVLADHHKKNQQGMTDVVELVRVRAALEKQFPGDAKKVEQALEWFENVVEGIEEPRKKRDATQVFRSMLNPPPKTPIIGKPSPEDFQMMRRMENVGQENMVALEGLLARIQQTRIPSVVAPPPKVVVGGKPGQITQTVTAAAKPVDLVEAYKVAVANADPDDPKATEELTKYAAKNGDHEGTVRYGTEALSRGSTDPNTRLLRGLAFEKLGDSEAANADARKLLEQNPNNRSALSLYKLTQGKASKISVDSKRPDFTGGQNVGALAKVVGIGAQQDPVRVLREAQRQAAGAGPGVEQKAALLRKEAYAALKVKDYRAAAKHAQRSVELDPNDAQGWYALATAQMRGGDYAAAAGAAERGLALAPENVPLLVTRSFALNRQQDYTMGYRDAAAAVRFQPNSAMGYYNRAYAGAGMGRRQEALADLRAAAELDARFQEKLQRAEALFEDDDMMFLFAEAMETAAQPAAAGGTESGKAFPLSKTVFILAGLLLLGLGLYHMLSPKGRERLTTLFGGSPTEDLDAIPDSGFWRRYDVIREIAAGGMGIVYEARDKSLDRRVAVKRMRDEISGDRRERERFLNEARIVAGMRHPNIVEIYSIEEDGDDAYLVFEYVDGKTLDEILTDKGSLSRAGSLEILRGVCEALEYSHQHKVIHRDLKPSNIMVNSEGTAKVMDFGVARRAPDAAEHIEQTHTVIGTPPYMAPEQEEGIIRPECDVYALGVCLYEMLSGGRPFQGTPGAVLLSKREGKYTPLHKAVEGMPESVSRVIDTALDPNPDRRYRRPRDFFAALEAATTSP